MKKFKGKKVAILGLSTEGRDTVKFFAREESSILCCDMRSRSELGTIYTSLSAYPVMFQLGKSYLQNLQDFDYIVKTQGMSPRLPELVSLRRQGKKITSNTALFFELCQARIIGVTGTKGKGTTSTLIYEILKSTGKQVFLGGNVGTPLLSKVRDIQSSDWVVLELSSFQLEDLQQSPHIAVVLPITQDHLANFDPLATNFHSSQKSYVEAKRSIIRFQSSSDIIVYNADNLTSSAFGIASKAKRFSFSGCRSASCDAYVSNHEAWIRKDGSVTKIAALGKIPLLGDHNLENIAAAALVSVNIGVSVSAICRAVKRFHGLPHRLELVRTVGGVAYYNDSFSTVPETTIAAIRSFNAPLILILGGSEKGSNFTQLGQKIAASGIVKAIIVIGQMTECIARSLAGARYQGKVVTGCLSMHEIVHRATKETRAGDIVLLSPACASFDM
ncbi:UDP-N-acetylmuramoyl-L-alanine--D-glutamate ligase, partial [Patescibacteria group bacterium]|nr:UDP-N-acetylmuramoyl-L-alanine--D-glutamate ligase [Patescibacteria group bacterium]